MLWLALLVILSPVLTFKGLTVEKLWSFFNLHPFLFVFCLGLLIKNPLSSHIATLQQKLDELEKKLTEREK